MQIEKHNKGLLKPSSGVEVRQIKSWKSVTEGSQQTEETHRDMLNRALAYDPPLAGCYLPTAQLKVY